MLTVCKLKDSDVSAPFPIPWDKVGILIPVSGVPDHLPETVDSVLNASGNGAAICVIDNGETHLNSGILRENYTFSHMKPEDESIKFIRIMSPDVENVYYCQTADGKNIYILEKSEKGKGKALNLGIRFADRDYIVCIDADSMLEEDALRNILLPFFNPEDTVFAVGGVIIPIHQNTLLCRFQEMEYTKAFSLSRVFYSKIGQTMLISGAFGAFRKDILIKNEIMCYDTGCIGEDLELTAKIQSYSAKHKYQNTVRYAQNAYCYTHVPDSFYALMHQRTRWQRGLIQVFNIYPPFGHKRLRFAAWLYFYFYERLSPIIETACFFFIVLCTVFNIENINIGILQLAVFLIIPTLLNLLINKCISGHCRLILCIVDSVFMHPVLMAVRFIAGIRERMHAAMTWK